MKDGEAVTEVAAASPASHNSFDPLLQRSSRFVRDGDFILLHFGDGRQLFCQCRRGRSGGGGGTNSSSSSSNTVVRIQKRTYATHNLVGLAYGTVLEQEQSKLVALPANAKLIPEFPDWVNAALEAGDDSRADSTVSSSLFGAANVNTGSSGLERIPKDNRSLVDTNTAQQLDQTELTRMRDDGVAGATIVASIIEHSTTFDQKTTYSKAKYVVRKQIKYQPRCRIVRCNAATICEALYLKEPKKVMNLREDTLAQILSYANLSAGCQTLVVETCMGIVTGAVAERLGGYGKVLAVYSGQQPSSMDMIAKYNLTFAENASIKWVHSGDVFGANHTASNGSTTTGSGAATAAATTAAAHATTPDDWDDDPEQTERSNLEWPCELQAHTINYIETELAKDDRKVTEFLEKRAARFARKLCRLSPTEAARMLHARTCDSVIVVARYHPTETLLGLLPFLAPSCPFVVFYEFIEPLTECFRHLQQLDLAINLRLSTTWMREYQVLDGRTHPSMNMSQSGGFILSGIFLPESGRNQLDEDLLKKIKEQIGGRRGRKNKKTNPSDGDPSTKKKQRGGKDTSNAR